MDMMKLPAIHCHLSFIFLVILTLPIGDARNTSDMRALMTLRAAFSTRRHLIPSWFNPEISPCNWYGIKCRGGAVEKIELTNIALKLPLPSCIGEFKSLQDFQASTAGLNGSIPKEFGYLQKLRLLDLSNNNLTGPLPDTLSGLQLIIDFSVNNNRLSGSISKVISNWKLAGSISINDNLFSGSLPPLNLPHLKTFFASRNQFSGEISSSICEAKFLKLLSLSDNKFSGSIKDTFKGCESLTELYLSSNVLHGEVPEYLADLPLVILDLSNNNFSGSIPDQLWSSQTIASISLDNNQLDGKIGKSIENSIGLINLNLDNNFIEGIIPQSIGKLKNLTCLSIHRNRLYGEIPSELFDCESLAALDLSYNSLSGQIPRTIANPKFLSSLILSMNNLSGQIPSDICSGFQEGAYSGILSIPHDGLLDLSYNKFVGPIPSAIGSCAWLQDLRLQRNRLEGSIPPELEEIKHLKFIDLSFNYFSGLIHTWRCSLKDLQGLLLSDNKFEGHIPSNLSLMFPNLVKLNFSRNHLTGSFPKSLFDMKFLEDIDISSNFMSGIIPFSSSLSLLQLNGSNNHFFGDMLYSVSDLPALYMLDLHNNNITGSLPLSLCDINTISYLDMSKNHLSGSIPCDICKSGNHPFVDFSGNDFPPEYSKPCEAKHFVSHPLLDVNRHPIFTRAFIYGICFGGMAIVIICMVLAFVIIRWRNHGIVFDFWPNKGNTTITESAPRPSVEQFLGSHRSSERISIDMVTFEPNLHRLTISDILQATENFNRDNIIGDGGFSTVYKADLGGRYGMVAIKRLKRTEIEIIQDREFLAEMQTNGLVKHDNLVPLLGYCISSDERLLIYKYMEKGSLDRWLWDRPTTEDALRWPDRLNICHGIACGLSFLHNSPYRPCILHRDMKSNNILLEENFHPRIADFGFARLMHPYEDHLSTNICGTIGYIPPEYSQMTMKATCAGDVYSFGVVILELLTGQHPLMRDKDGEENLVEWVQCMYERGNVELVLDPTLVEDQSNIPRREQIKKVLLLAIACTTTEPRKRPTMPEVFEFISKIRLNVASGDV